MPETKITELSDAEIEREAEDIVDAITKLAGQSDKINESSAKNIFERIAALTANDPLTQYELVSVKALISYIAHTQKLPPLSLNSLLEMKFDVTKIEAITRKDYQHAIKFLVDLQGYGSLN